MAPRRYAPVDPRLPIKDLHRLHSHVQRRRPKAKIQRPPEYYENLIKRHDDPKTAIRNKYADTTKDNLSGIKGKFTKFAITSPERTGAL